jgi:hypothetical protein
MNNIALYLRLTPYFIYILSKNKDYINTNKLLRIYKRYKIDDIFHIINRISIVNNQLKLFYLVFLYKLLDKKEYNNFLNTNKNYKQFITCKINKIKDNILTNNQRLKYGLEYIYNNFVDNKRYFYVRKNKKYYKNLLIIYLKTIALTLKWYRETLEKTYAPGGKGYFEARDDFLRIKEHIELEKIKC